MKTRTRTLEIQLNADRTAGLAATTELARASADDRAFSGDNDLTDNAAFDLFTIPVADEAGVCIKVDVCVFCDDGTDHQMIPISVLVSAVNKGGTVTATVTELAADAVAASAGTLTLAVAAAEGAANILDVYITANTSLTPTTFTCSWLATVLHGGTVTAVNANAA